jgi:hypothetical protein
MKRISGGQTSVGADARLLSSHAGDPRAARGDTTDTSHTGRHTPAGGQPVMESARRRPEDLPAGSDVTGPRPETLTQRPVIRDDRLEGVAILSRFPAAFPLPAFASRSSDARRGVGPSSRSAYQNTPSGASRTSTGLPLSARTSYRRRGCLLYPEDGDAHPGRGTCPAGACRSTAASPSHPAPTFPSTRGCVLRGISRRFRFFTRPACPSPVAPGWNGRPWASPRASHPAVTGSARRGRGQVVEHGPGTTRSHQTDPPIR